MYKLDNYWTFLKILKWKGQFDLPDMNLKLFNFNCYTCIKRINMICFTLIFTLKYIITNLRSWISRSALSPDISFWNSGAENISNKSGLMTDLNPLLKAAVCSLICRYIRKCAIKWTYRILYLVEKMFNIKYSTSY